MNVENKNHTFILVLQERQRNWLKIRVYRHSSRTFIRNSFHPISSKENPKINKTATFVYFLRRKLKLRYEITCLSWVGSVVTATLLPSPAEEITNFIATSDQVGMYVGLTKHVHICRYVRGMLRVFKDPHLKKISKYIIF